jgi:hypothetical protein
MSELIDELKLNNQRIFDAGHSQGLTDVIERQEAFLTNKPQTYYDIFWNVFQQNGNRTDYTNIFAGVGWTAEIFKPAHDIKPITATAMFKDSTMEIDLAKHLKSLGISLDFSNCTRLGSCFQNSKVTKIGVIDASNVVGANASDIFTGSDKLVTIELLVLNSNAATGGSFGGCTALQNLTIGGAIGLNFSVKDCVNLTKNSISSIVEHLSDSATSRTVTFSQTAVDNAFTPEEWAALEATKPKWNIALV